MAKKIIVFNAARCQGCKTCVVECAVSHSGAVSVGEAMSTGRTLQARVHVESLGELGGMPVQCRQCDDAPCTLVCPKGALHRPTLDTPVLLDTKLCGGCKMCILACPYGVIDVSKEGKAVVKCDMCFDRMQHGELPACVEGCPLGGLEVVEIDEDLRVRHRRVAERVTENARNRSASMPSGQKMAVCEVCGNEFAAAKQLEFVRKKLPANIPVANVCHTCRRRETAALIASVAAEV